MNTTPDRITTYSQAEDFLAGRPSRKAANNTYVVRFGPEIIGVRLHGTYVVEFVKSGAVLARTGGYVTTTTFDRLNRFTPDRFGFFRRAGVGYVCERIALPDYDAVLLDPDGPAGGAVTLPGAPR